MGRSDTWALTLLGRGGARLTRWLDVRVALSSLHVAHGEETRLAWEDGRSTGQVVG
jgi:hypothetical protein